MSQQTDGVDPELARKYLHWLSPAMRKDYRAVKLRKIPKPVQADRRGVNYSTVYSNVATAEERLASIIEQEE